MRFFFLFFLSFCLPFIGLAQFNPSSGRIQGNILSAVNQSAIPGVTVVLQQKNDSLIQKMAITNEQGEFVFDDIPFGFYSLQLTSSGLNPVLIDSLHLRSEKTDIALPDMVMNIRTTGLETIVIYAEKPLIETKDGNIIFNATESPLSAGSNASDLLRNIPLVTQDPDGKVTVRGREPRILIDDKPVEMNARQMQDFLESLPGNMIEKIEVMTNPPAQYANEPGGVINIVTRKGRTGWNARLNISAGTRGEFSTNANAGMRRKGLSVQFSIGTGYNNFLGQSSSSRQNRYSDSTNRLLTSNQSNQTSWRPFARLSIDQDLDTRNSLGIVFQFNANSYLNLNTISYRNENRFTEIYKSSIRKVQSAGDNLNPDLNLSYTHKGKRKGEQLRFNASAGYSGTDGIRDFRQTFFNASLIPNGKDSTQQQDETTISRNLSIRLAYDKPIIPEKTILSTATAYLLNMTLVDQQTYDKLNDGQTKALRPGMTNLFQFTQEIVSATLALRQRIIEGLWFSSGMTFESTDIQFDLINDDRKVTNGYENWLPFARISRHGNPKTNMSLVYRSSIRRPGIRELNPAIDYTDPYNFRFGNASLLPSPTHSFDLNVGRNLDQFQMNAGLGYNRVDDIFATVRTLQPDGKTYITWQNISGREEFEANGWVNMNISKAFRMNANASYTYNRYSEYDIRVNRYRNAASIYGRVNLTLAPKPQLWNATTSIGLNRYANPQGTVRSTVNMIFGAQYRFFKRKLIVTTQIIDPFIQQEYRTITEGVNFTTVGQNLTTTRNFRLTLGYNLSGTVGSRKHDPANYLSPDRKIQKSRGKKSKSDN